MSEIEDFKSKFLNNKIVAEHKSLLEKLFGSSDSLDDNDEIHYIPTMLSSFNRAIVLGGAPIESIYEIYGRPASGKSTFAAIILASAQKLGHYAAYFDLEGAVDKEWFSSIGIDSNKLFYRCKLSLEDCADTIDSAISEFSNNRDDNKYLFIVVDSVTKLIPRDVLFGKISTSNFGLQAKLLSEWLKKLTYHLPGSGVSIIFINQERQKIGAKPYEYPYRTTTGEAIGFDAKVRIRLSFAGFEKESDVKVGKIHRGLIEKNKVGYPDNYFTFYTSNGNGIVPIGVDYYRESIDEAVFRGIVKKSGRFYVFDNNKYNSLSDFISAMIEDSKIYRSLRNSLGISGDLL